MTARKENPQKASIGNPLKKQFRNPRPATDLVKEVTQIEITGNVIPMNWFNHITVKTSTKTRPHLLAINILADVVYWYKSKEIRDERSGKQKGIEKKFKGELLQRSYGQIANTFGVSKEQARSACRILESHGLIYCHFRDIEDMGRKLFNVMYIEPYPAKINHITHGKTADMSVNSERGSIGKPREGSMGIPKEGLSEFPKTNTETSITKTSITKNTNTEILSLPDSDKIAIPSQSGFDAFKAEYERLYLESQGMELDGHLHHLDLIARKLKNDIGKLQILLSNFPKSWWGDKKMRPTPDYVFKFLDKNADSLSMNFKGETTAAQRDKFGGDDTAVQKIADEAIRRAEDGAREYLANGGLIF